MENLLKSIFVAIFPMMALFGLYLGMEQILIGNPDRIAIGISLTSITIILFFGGLFVVSQARTKRYLPVYTSIIVLGYILSLSTLLYHPTPTFKLIIASLILISWFLYVYWYSVLDRRSETQFVKGDQIPDLLLEDIDHKPISLRSFIGNPTIFMFYRGNWCPLCMAQIKEIARQYKELEQLGVNMVFISPQPNKFSSSLANKYDLGFHFLTDIHHEAAKHLGIYSKNGLPAGFQLLGYDSDTVLPTVIITNSNGKIVFNEVADNYRVRPEPETFLKVIRKLEDRK